MLSLDTAALAQVFTEARTFNRFKPDTVTEETLHRLYDLLKWGPTSMNAQPGRYLFLRSSSAKARLQPCLSPGNVDKTVAAPVCVLVATDTQFYEHLPTQFKAFDAKPMFTANEALAATTAHRNGTLQGAYLIIAARMLGLDCGPMSGFDAAKADAEFFPDGRYRSNFLVNLGYGDPAGNYPRGPRLSFEDVARVL
jgi:3-hydroxypropanoate dehydrogenase